MILNDKSWKRHSNIDIRYLQWMMYNVCVYIRMYIYIHIYILFIICNAWGIVAAQNAHHGSFLARRASLFFVSVSGCPAPIFSPKSQSKRQWRQAAQQPLRGAPTALAVECAPKTRHKLANLWRSLHKSSPVGNGNIWSTKQRWWQLKHFLFSPTENWGRWTHFDYIIVFNWGGSTATVT